MRGTRGSRLNKKSMMEQPTLPLKMGWMEAETFSNFFTNSFTKNIHPERPAVLVYDGHVSHLMPHKSHILQPMDLFVFRPLRLMKDKELIKWQRENHKNKLLEAVFGVIVLRIWMKLNLTIIQCGFQNTGIFPFSSTVVAKVNFDPAAYQTWCAHQAKEPAARDVHSTSNQTVEPAPYTLSYASEEADSLQQICGGAEVITSLDAVAQFKEKEAKIKNRKQVENCRKTNSDDENLEQLLNESDENEPEEDLREMTEEQGFMEIISSDVSALQVGDWIISKFCPKKRTLMYIAQVLDISLCIKVKLDRHLHFIAGCR
ncbi:hypothetical protein ILUMI_05077 [Ignelater luminosus]|uniref:DDE-1 domain-containing protein n=1 Tax=Ignelater luminosus TaxID=2038154 RepID=A0A8K0GIG2_IGNLU|nr:hypothetical protein ILUMI_05077 [Ignelater luminosus]